MVNMKNKTIASIQNNWSLLLFILLTYSAIEIPLNLVFDYELRSLLLINTIVNVIFALDIFYNFWIHKKKDPTNGKIKYLKSWFVVDFLSALPFELLLELDYIHDDLDALKILRMLRIIRVIKIFNLSGRFSQNEFQGQGKKRIITLLYISVVGAHWISLLWSLIIDIEPEQTNVTTYIKALYWTITTLTTIGYGDITPQNDPQRIFTMAVMIIGAGMYGYIIGNISNLLANIDYARTVFSEKMERINTFLKYRKIPESLQENIYQYYTYVWENKKGYDESDIMSELPASLRMKISLYLNADVFDKIPIFEGASEAMIADFVIKLKPVIFTPNDYIIKKGERGDCLYFISKGQVEVINDDTGDTIATLGVGAYFGEIALIDSAPRNATIRAREYCDLYSLDKLSFDEVIKEYPDFYEKIKIMAKKRMEENRLKVLNQTKN